ncbi:MAG: TIGR01777 family oxidoreductase [Deltaproteobacteria bacterium]|nr:TIGR01777 family oxidoreductase [Deltaproteobacteria bacterium]
MKVLITGATGLIGSELGRVLALRGDQITALVRDPIRVQASLPFPAMLVKWAADEPMSDEVRAALLSVDAIVHLAGEPVADGRWTDERKKRIRESRINGTASLVGALKEAGSRSSVKVFVHGSAIGIYGNRGDEILDHQSSRGSGFLADVVAAWEAELDVLSTEKEIRTVTLRTSVVLARHGGALKKMLPIFRNGLGARLGLSGDQWMSWIHLDDMIRLLIHAIDSSKVAGVIEAAAPQPVRNKDFTTSFCEGLDVLQGPPVPEFALKLLYGEMASVLFDSQRVVPTATKATGFEFHFQEIGVALADLLAPLRDQTHELLAEQWVPVSVDKVWPYFCDEKNLEELTPPLLSFQVLGKSTDRMQEGTLIDYRLSLNGIPFSWQTRIEDWVPGKRFVDNQLKGPYSLWHHTHEFLPMAGGTLLRDRVFYRLPMGILGNVAAGWKVVRDVDTIFKYRRKVIHEKFGKL